MTMKDNLNEFLESSLLEEYVLGVIDPEQKAVVEHYINTYPEVKSAYDELQENLEMLANKMAAAPPPGTRESIMNKLEDDVTTTADQPSFRRPMWLAAALALLLGVSSLLLFQNNRDLQTQVESLQSDYTALEDRCNENELLFAQREADWEILADPRTKALLLNGNDRAAALETVAYWNESDQSAYLRILSFPDVPADQCLQLWADVDGEMVSVAILEDKRNEVIAIPFKVAATSLNITIEPKGGSDHATVENLVASVAI